jgi:hypothetical protein
MALYISNTTSETLNASLLIYDPSCTIGGQPWRKEAWWVIGARQTVKPNALDLNLRTVNQWVGLYAYTASGDKSWQGTGNAWFEVTGGLGFNQCGENQANCVKWVDYYGLNLNGASEYVAYVGPNSNQVTGGGQSISIAAGVNQLIGPGFYVSGSGFIPGSTITIQWEYAYDGGVAENLSAATITVGSNGTFSDLVPVYWVTYAGTLNVKAVDSAWGLNASATEVVS